MPRTKQRSRGAPAWRSRGRDGGVVSATEYIAEIAKEAERHAAAGEDSIGNAHRRVKVRGRTHKRRDDSSHVAKTEPSRRAKCSLKAHRQSGSNCREVALAHVLRLKRLPTQMELAAAARELLRTSFPEEVAHFDARQGTSWTLSGAGYTDLMTHFVESRLSMGYVSLYIASTEESATPAPTSLAVAPSRWGIGADDLGELATDGPDAFGFCYFSRGHCMSCVRCPSTERWYKIEKNSPQAIGLQRAMRLATGGATAGAGCGVVLVLPREATKRLESFVRVSIAAALKRGVASLPKDELEALCHDAVLALRCRARLGTLSNEHAKELEASFGRITGWIYARPTIFSCEASPFGEDSGDQATTTDDEADDHSSCDEVRPTGLAEIVRLLRAAASSGGSQLTARRSPERSAEAAETVVPVGGAGGYSDSPRDAARRDTPADEEVRAGASAKPMMSKTAMRRARREARRARRVARSQPTVASCDSR